MEIHFANPRCKELPANVHAVDRAENPDLRLPEVQWFCSDRVNQFGKKVSKAEKITIGCSDRGLTGRLMPQHEWAGSTSATALECRFLGVKVWLDFVMHLAMLHPYLLRCPVCFLTPPAAASANSM